MRNVKVDRDIIVDENERINGKGNEHQSPPMCDKRFSAFGNVSNNIQQHNYH